MTRLVGMLVSSLNIREAQRFTSLSGWDGLAHGLFTFGNYNEWAIGGRLLETPIVLKASAGSEPGTGRSQRQIGGRHD